MVSAGFLKCHTFSVSSWLQRNCFNYSQTLEKSLHFVGCHARDCQSKMTLLWCQKLTKGIVCQITILEHQKAVKQTNEFINLHISYEQ